jgi:hypothetical protein
MLLICAGFDPILRCWFYPIADNFQDFFLDRKLSGEVAMDLQRIAS